MSISRPDKVLVPRSENSIPSKVISGLDRMKRELYPFLADSEAVCKRLREMLTSG